MAQQGQAWVSKPENLHLIPGPTWWEEKTDSHCPVTFVYSITCAHTHAWKTNKMY